MNGALILAALSATLAIAAITWKIVHWRNYRKNYNRRQPFKALYSSNEIEGSSSNIKKDFLRMSNLISAGIGVALLVLAFSILGQVMLGD